MAHFKTLFPSLYLGAHDLQGREVVLTIRRVVVEELKTSGGSERKPTVYFQETQAKAAQTKTEEKRLVLNKTNAKAIAKMYGAEVNDWTGKRITVYSASVAAFGEQVDAIRVRPVPPPPVAAQPQPEESKQ